MEEILLGVDLGEKHTGLAFGRAGAVSPLHVIDSKDPHFAIAQIAKTALEIKASKVIIGLPTDAEGKETHQSREVRRFGKLLRIHLKRPVEFISEYNTSLEAVETAIRSGISQKSRKLDHHLAAALILKRYYNEHEGESTS